MMADGVGGTEGGNLFRKRLFWLRDVVCSFHVPSWWLGFASCLLVRCGWLVSCHFVLVPAWLDFAAVCLRV